MVDARWRAQSTHARVGVAARDRPRALYQYVRRVREGTTLSELRERALRESRFLQDAAASGGDRLRRVDVRLRQTRRRPRRSLRMSLRICSKRLSKGSSVPKSSSCLTRLTSDEGRTRRGNAWPSCDLQTRRATSATSAAAPRSVARAAGARVEHGARIIIVMGAGSSSKDARRHLNQSSRSLVEAHNPRSARRPWTRRRLSSFPTWATAMTQRRSSGRSALASAVDGAESDTATAPGFFSLFYGSGGGFLRRATRRNNPQIIPVRGSSSRASASCSAARAARRPASRRAR